VPEGNEIHRFAKLHAATYVGKTICVESPNGRFPGAALLTGRKLKSVIAHGKHLAYDFGRDLKLHIHMGRFGDFTEGKMPYPEVKGVLRMRWSTATDWLELRGATDVSVYSDAQWKAVEARLGADPLEPNADPSAAILYIRKANAPIAALLMDQTLFAGIGNIYRAELLYRARQDPFVARRCCRGRGRGSYAVVRRLAGQHGRGVVAAAGGGGLRACGGTAGRRAWAVLGPAACCLRSGR